MSGLAYTPQPPPAAGRRRVLDLVIADLTARAEVGRTKYGTYLETHNGRNAAVDAYQEVLDLLMYAMQARAEGNQSFGVIYEVATILATELAYIVHSSQEAASETGERVSDAV